jgi:hypothetical protein
MEGNLAGQDALTIDLVAGDLDCCALFVTLVT